MLPAAGMRRQSIRTSNVPPLSTSAADKVTCGPVPSPVSCTANVGAAKTAEMAQAHTKSRSRSAQPDLQHPLPEKVCATSLCMVRVNIGAVMGKVKGCGSTQHPFWLQPLMIRGSIIWCWGQMERGFW